MIRRSETPKTGWMTTLHVRSDLHLARKAWHMIMGLFIVAVYMGGMSRSLGVLVLGFVLGVNLIVETARLKIPALNEKVIKMWGPLMRTCEMNRYSGTPYYIAAAIIAVGIFPQPIAALSIAFLAVGDPLASLFGILYGDKSVRFSNGKSLIGTAAGVIACAFVALVFLALMNHSGMMNLSQQQILILAAVGGLAGGGAELLPMEVDDNFAIPVVSGFVLWLAFIVMGISSY